MQKQLFRFFTPYTEIHFKLLSEINVRITLLKYSKITKNVLFLKEEMVPNRKTNGKTKKNVHIF